MKDLETCRQEIDSLDSQIASLFEQRMAVSKDVITYKLANNLPIFQPEREQIVLEKNSQRIKDQDLQKYALSFFQDMMDTSKAYQASFIPLSQEIELTKPMETTLKAGYQGVPGSFSNQALQQYFGKIESVYFPKFEDVYIALMNQTIDYGIVPLENSNTGSINDNYDLLRLYNCFVVGEISIPITQHLLAKEGAKVETIRDVYSHPQGILQSSKYLDEHPNMDCHDFTNTAAAAKYVSEQDDFSKAAIASLQAAKIYGLKVIQENIHTQENNHTRFIVISRNLEKNKKANIVSIVFTLDHKVGALYSILKTVKNHHLNLTRIESRPIVDQEWQYYFYIDFNGNLEDRTVQVALQQMRSYCLTLDVIGNYEA